MLSQLLKKAQTQLAPHIQARLWLENSSARSISSPSKACRKALLLIPSFFDNFEKLLICSTWMKNAQLHALSRKSLYIGKIFTGKMDESKVFLK